MLSELVNTDKKVVGTKQVLKALESKTAKTIYLAQDIDSALMAKITDAAKAVHCDLVKVETMEQLGKDCGIQVGAATAAILK